MLTFNSWYYSFSPYVAPHLRANDMGGEGVRLILYPLIGVMQISSWATDLSALHGYSVIIGGFLASSMIGAIYLSPMVWLGLRGRRSQVLRKLTICTFGVSAIALLIAELANIGSISTISGVVFVLSSMVSSGATVALLVRNLFSRKTN